MKVVECLNDVKLPVRLISSPHTSIDSNVNVAQPKMKMVWQTEWRDGRELLVAQWVADE